MREPGKAAWLALENDDDLAFSFYLAEKLGRTVEELGTMRHAEFVLWSRHFARHAQQQQLAERMAAQ